MIIGQLLRRCIHTSARLTARSNQNNKPPHVAWSLYLERPSSNISFGQYRSLSARAMSTSAPHPISSTSDPAAPAEGLSPITPESSSAHPKANGQKEVKAKGGADGEGKQSKKDKKEKKASGSATGGVLDPPPEYFAERIKIYDEYKEKYDQWVSGESTHHGP